MNPKKKFYETAAETLIKNLDKRGMEAYYVDFAKILHSQSSAFYNLSL